MNNKYAPTTNRRQALRSACCKTMLAAGITLLAAAPLQAQPPVFKWAKQMGGSGLCEGVSLVLDASGNIYTTGYFSGTADFDPGPGVAMLTSAGGQDAFIMKQDPSGNLLWARRVGGAGNEYGSDIAIDAMGNAYTVGYFMSTSADFDPGSGTKILTKTGDYNGYVLKLDAGGNFSWVQQLSGTGSCYAYGIHVDGSGNIYAGGSFSGAVDFDPGTGTNILTSTSTDMFLAKWDAAANPVWLRNIPSAGIRRIATDASGNIYAVGGVDGTTDLDPGPGTHTVTSKGLMDVHILKLDASGNFVWARQIGGPEPDWPRGLAVDGTGNVYVSGTFDSEADFDIEGSSRVLHSIGGSPGPDGFLTKINAAGTFGWVKQLGSLESGLESVEDVVIDSKGDIYFTGKIGGQVNFDMGGTGFWLEAVSGADIFVCKTDASGAFQWAVQTEGRGWGSGSGSSLAVDNSGLIYTTGYFSDTTDFDPGTGVYEIKPQPSATDVFVWKLAPFGLGTAEIGKAATIKVSPNPCRDLVDIVFPQATGDWQLKISNAVGQTMLSADHINTHRYQLDMGNKPPGLYFVELSGGGQRTMLKLVKD